MAINITTSSTGVNLYNSTATFYPDSTVTIPALSTNVRISLSFYLGFNNYYNGRAFDFQATIYDSLGQGWSGTGSIGATQNRHRLNLTITLGTYINQATISSITLRQTGGYISTNNATGYWANVRPNSESPSTINVDSYDEYKTAVSAPSSVYFDNSTSVTSKSIAPNTSVTLYWSAGSAGYNTTVASYSIYRSTNSTSASSYTLLQSGITGRSYTVTSGSNGTVYRYKIVSVSSPAGYNSGQSSAVATLTSAITAPSVPTNVRLDSTYLSSGATTTLRWDASTAGTNNAVSGYTVYIDGVAQTATSTTNYTVTAASSGTRSFTVRANGANGVHSNQSSAVTLYTYTAPTAPTSISVSPTEVAPGGSATLSWSGAKDGTYNTISGYEVHRSTSSTSGFTLMSGGSVDASITSITVTAPTSQGSTYYYVVYVKGTRGGTSVASQTVSLKSYSYSAVGAPTSITVSPTIVVAGGSATLSWSGATSGTHTSVSSYLVHRSTDGINYTPLSGGQTTGTTLSVTAPSSGSYYYKVQSVASLSGYDSALSTPYAILSVNRAPNPPTTVVASPTIYETGNVTVTWVAGTEPDGQAVSYEVQYQVGSGSWTAFGSGTSTVAEASIVDSFPRGSTAKFRVRSKDSLGGVSDWVESNTITRNDAPSTASLVFVKSSGTGTTYSVRPKILVTIGGSEQVTVYATGYTCSASGLLTPGTQIEFVASSDQTAGSKTVTFTVTDTHGASSSVEYKFTVAIPTFTDDPIVSRTTKIKAVHITELRNGVDTVRSFYGLSSYSWKTVMQSGVTKLSSWLSDIKEIRTAMIEAITKINGWDYTNTTGNVTVPTWISVVTNSPSAEVMNQLRLILKSL